MGIRSARQRLRPANSYGILYLSTEKYGITSQITEIRKIRKIDSKKYGFYGFWSIFYFFNIFRRFSAFLDGYILAASGTTSTSTRPTRPASMSPRRSTSPHTTHTQPVIRSSDHYHYISVCCEQMNGYPYPAAVHCLSTPRFSTFSHFLLSLLLYL